MKKTLIWLGVAVLLTVIIWGASALYGKLIKSYSPDNMIYTDSETSGIESEGRYAAPDFTVLDNNGEKLKLSDIKGKPVVVNFWASWCPPCKNEMPDFEKAYQKYGNDISFMIVNMTDGQRETVEKAKSHIEENGYTFPVYYDYEMSAAYAYQVNSIPATYFVDKDGNLVTYAAGMISLPLIEKGIEMIMK